MRGFCAGAREVTAGCADDLLRLLDAGTLARATSGTLLNEQSSRSHAIFTLILEQTVSTVSILDSSSMPSNAAAANSGDSSSSSTNESCKNDSSSANTNSSDGRQVDAASRSASSLYSTLEADAKAAELNGSTQVEFRCSKFHLVDLAGSERAGRSGAAGVRFKETVNINQVHCCWLD